MSTYLYDEALVRKFRSWTHSSQIEIFGPNEFSRVIELMADRSGDKPIELPIIYIERDRGFNIINNGTTRRPLSYDGKDINADSYQSEILNAIPISISYQVNVYTRYAKEADILVRNLIFNVINYPGLEVIVPKVGIYNKDTDSYDEFKHTARIEFGNTEIQDNSNEKERFIEGNYTKLSFLITINDAYLWDLREHRTADIEILIEDKTD